MRLRKTIAALLATIMTLSLISVQAFADETNGIPEDSWSTAALKAAVSNGLLVGDQTGHVQPKKNITRAETVAVIVRAFGATGGTPIASDSWYAADMGKGIYMGIIDSGDLRPDSPATREEVFSMLSRALKASAQTGGSSTALDSFSDGGSVSADKRADLAAMVSAGYVKGSLDNATNTVRLFPQSSITREEFAQVMFTTIRSYVNGSNVTSVNNGNVMVRESGTVLNGVTVQGDLIVGDGVGNGDVTIRNSTVSGRLLARGGGRNTIYVENTTVGGGLYAAKRDGNLRVQAQGAKIENSRILEGTQPVALNGSFGNISVSGTVPFVLEGGSADSIQATGSGTSVTLNSGASASNVALSGGSTHLNLSGGTASNVTTSGNGTRIRVDSGTISQITANGSNTVVYGSGNVPNVAVNANNCAVYTGPTTVKIATGSTNTTVGGTAVNGGTESKTTQPITPPSSVIADVISGGVPSTTGTTTTTPQGLQAVDESSSNSSSNTTVSVSNINVQDARTFTFRASAKIDDILVDDEYVHIDGRTRPYAESSGDSGTVTWTVHLDSGNELDDDAKTLEVCRDGYKDYVNKSALKYVMPTGISVSPSSLSLTAGEANGKLSATVRPSSASNAGISWYSSDNSVATVNQNGQVTPVSAGTATITVRTDYNGYEAYCSVTVAAKQVTVDHISVVSDPAKMTYNQGETLDLTGIQVQITYRNSNTDTVPLSAFASSGLTASPAHGTATTMAHNGIPIVITHTTSGKTAQTSANLSVTGVAPVVTSLAVTAQPAALQYTQGDALDLSGLMVTLTYSDSSTRAVGLADFADYSLTASPSNGTALTVASNNNRPVVITHAPTSRTASTDNLSVTVGPVPLTGISLNKNTTTIRIGATENLIPVFQPSNADNKGVSWSSDDPTIAQVSTTGVVTGVSKGSTAITVTADEGGFSDACIVTVSDVTYTVSFSQPTGGTVSAKVDGNSITSDSSVENGKVVSFEGMANSGYSISGWKINGITQGAANPYNHTVSGGNVTAELILTKDFVPVTDVAIPTTGTTGTQIDLSTVAVTPSDATNTAITWSLTGDDGSTNHGGLIGGNKVTPTTAGTLTVTATVVNGLGVGTNYVKTQPITITAPFVPVTAINNIPTAGIINTELDFSTLTVFPANATNQTIVWSISDSDDNSTNHGGMTGGKVTPSTTGTLIVKATVTNGTAPGTDFAPEYSITISNASYTLSAPTPVSANGVTATVTFDKTSPVAEADTVTATVTLTGMPDASGAHVIDLTSVAAGLSSDPKTEAVTAGTALAGVTKTFSFTMPAAAVADLVLTNTFTAGPMAVLSGTDIEGIATVPMVANPIDLQLSNDTFSAAFAIEEDISSWFSNLPDGLSARVYQATAIGADAMEITIHGIPATMTDSPVALSATVPQSKLTVSSQDLTATGAVTVTIDPVTFQGMTITTQPTLSYDEGDPLDLSAMVLSLQYTDGDIKPVTFNDFATEGITTNPTNGTTLSASRDGTTVSVILAAENNYTLQTNTLSVTPSFSGSFTPASPNLIEGDTAVDQAAAGSFSTQGAEGTVTYAFSTTTGGEDNGSFDLNTSTGALALNSTGETAGAGTYAVEVTATDSGGGATAVITGSVTIDAQVFDGFFTAVQPNLQASGTAEEGAKVGEFSTTGNTGSVSYAFSTTTGGAHNHYFDLHSTTGVLTLNAAGEAAGAGTHIVEVTATDHGNNATEVLHASIVIDSAATITYTAYANGSSDTETSTEIILEFSQPVTGLTSVNVPVDDSKHNVGLLIIGDLELASDDAGENKKYVYTLDESVIAKEGSISIRVINMEHVDNSSKSVEIYKEAVEVQFISLTQDRSPGGCTTQCFFELDQDIPGLSADDISIIGFDDTQIEIPGSFGRTGVGEYWFDIMPLLILDETTITIAITKKGYTFTPATQQVLIYNDGSFAD